MTLPLLTDQKESPGVTFAEPGSSRGFSDVMAETGSIEGEYHRGNPQAILDIYRTAERSTRLTGNMVSEAASREEAYDRRIAAVKAATGIELENPERGGYAIDARRAIRDEVRAGGLQPIDAKGGVPEYQKRLFDEKLAALQKDHPDLDFGSLDTEARTLAKGAADAAAKAAAADVDPVSAFIASFAGGTVGSRRDPLFIGSMFAGPTAAVGRTAFARIATSSLFTGLFNAGVSAVEQPTVQDWRARIGMESGVIPALHDVGMAFVLGLIPGAAVQGIKEGLATPLRRVLAGHPEPGDLEAIHAGLTPAAPREAAALAAGAESTAADRATLTIPEPKGIDPALHNDMLAAALKRADDPAEASPEAVRAVRDIETRPAAEAPPAAEIERRITEAAPKSEREAIAAADEALDDIGRREGAAVLRKSIDTVKAEQAALRERGGLPPDIPDDLFHGFGREDQKSVYNQFAPAEPILGPARYYAFERKVAEGYGPQVEPAALSKVVENPLIIRDGDEWRKLTKSAGWDVPNPFGTEPKKLAANIASLRAKVESQGHDGVIVWWDDKNPGDTGPKGENIKLLRNVFGDPQAIAFKQPAERAPKAASKDPIGKIPWLDDSGNPKLLTPKAAAAIGERDDMFAMLVRSCK